VCCREDMGWDGMGWRSLGHEQGKFCSETDMAWHYDHNKNIE